MDDAIWSLKVSRHMLLSATWCEMVVLGRDRVPAVERGAFLLLRPVSSQHGSSSKVITSVPSQMGLHSVPEGREDELRSMTLPGCSMLPLLLPCPMGLVLPPLSCWDQEGKTRPVPQTISVAVTAPLVSSAQTPCDDTLQCFLRPRMAVPPALQPASTQQSSAALASLFFFFLTVNYWHRRCWIIHWFAC